MKFIIEKLKEHIPQMIIALISFLLGTIIYHLENYVPVHILNLPSKLLLVKTSVILLLIVMGVFVYSLYLRSKLSNKININDYEFIDNPGYYSHKKRGGHYCHPCLISGLESPLSINDQFYMRCLKCNTEVQINPVKLT